MSNCPVCGAELESESRNYIRWSCGKQVIIYSNGAVVPFAACPNAEVEAVKARCALEIIRSEAKRENARHVHIKTCAIVQANAVLGVATQSHPER